MSAVPSTEVPICLQMVQLSPTSTCSLRELNHCYQSGVLIGYRTLPVLSETSTHKQGKCSVFSTTTTPEHLLSIVLNRSPVSSTLFYTEGEPDIERVKAWLRTIDDHYPMNTKGAIYLGTKMLSVREFVFRRLKTQWVNPCWVVIDSTEEG